MALSLAAAMGLMAGAQAAGAIGKGLSQIDRLTPEQKKRMEELKRQEALGLLGLSASEEQRLLNQQLQPVRATQRQAQTRFDQSQQVADIGLGSSFRQQQAQQAAEGQVMQQATQDAQLQVQELEQLAIARQKAELAKLQAQRQKNKDAIAGIFGGLADAGSQAALLGYLESSKKQNEKMLLDAKKSISKKNAGKTTEITEDYLPSLMDDDADTSVISQPLNTQNELAIMNMLENNKAQAKDFGIDDIVNPKDIVSTPYGTAEVIRDDVTGIAQKVKLIRPSGKIDEYELGEPVWDSLMFELKNTGWKE